MTDWCDVALSTSVLQRWVMFVTSDVSKNVTRHEYFPTCYSRKYRSIISGIFNEMLSLSHGLSQQFLTGFCNGETRRLFWACANFFVSCKKKIARQALSRINFCTLVCTRISTIKTPQWCFTLILVESTLFGKELTNPQSACMPLMQYMTRKP